MYQVLGWPALVGVASLFLRHAGHPGPGQADQRPHGHADEGQGRAAASTQRDHLGHEGCQTFCLGGAFYCKGSSKKGGGDQSAAEEGSSGLRLLLSLEHDTVHGWLRCLCLSRRCLSFKALKVKTPA